jgi:hypothetical protein
VSIAWTSVIWERKRLLHTFSVQDHLHGISDLLFDFLALSRSYPPFVARAPFLRHGKKRRFLNKKKSDFPLVRRFSGPSHVKLYPYRDTQQWRRGGNKKLGCRQATDKEKNDKFDEQSEEEDTAWDLAWLLLTILLRKALAWTRLSGGIEATGRRGGSLPPPRYYTQPFQLGGFNSCGGHCCRDQEAERIDTMPFETGLVVVPAIMRHP